MFKMRMKVKKNTVVKAKVMSQKKTEAKKRTCLKNPKSTRSKTMKNPEFTRLKTRKTQRIERT